MKSADPWAILKWYRCSKCNQTFKASMYHMLRFHKQCQGEIQVVAGDPRRSEAIRLHPGTWGVVKSNIWHMRTLITGGARCCGTHRFSKIADTPPEDADICGSCLSLVREDAAPVVLDDSGRSSIVPYAVFQKPEKYQVDCYELGDLIYSKGFSTLVKARSWAKIWVGHSHTYTIVLDDTGAEMDKYRWPSGWESSKRTSRLVQQKGNTGG